MAVFLKVCSGSRLGRIGTLPQTFHTIASDVPTMESVAVDQGQALQVDRCEICHERRFRLVRVSLAGNAGWRVCTMTTVSGFL